MGSVGTRCWVALFEGPSASDPLFLQFKQARESVLAPYVKGPRVDHQGRRVLEGQRLIQGAPDIFLGWADGEGHDFYVRQLRDMKGGVDLEPGNIRPSGLVEYAMLCGWALALAHAKSGDAAMISGYTGKSEALDDALTGFAFAYADQAPSATTRHWKRPPALGASRWQGSPEPPWATTKFPRPTSPRRNAGVRVTLGRPGAADLADPRRSPAQRRAASAVDTDFRAFGIRSWWSEPASAWPWRRAPFPRRSSHRPVDWRSER